MTAVTMNEPITWGTMLIILAVIALFFIAMYFAKRS